MDIRAAIIVPTCNAGPQFQNFLNAINGQSRKLDITIVDSSSSDDTVAVAHQFAVNLIHIRRDKFNHGGTRKMAVNHLRDTDVVVFLTQDAVLSSYDSIDRILSYFDDEAIAAVCGRQLPRKSASPIEAHARIYNYSSMSFIRTIDDIKKYGLKAAFISNSFAAYRVSAYRKVGGFPENVIFGEDMYMAAKFLLAGYKIAYTADACVYHSHNYSLIQEMKRYFDMGVFHAREPWIRQQFGTAESEGLKFVISEIKYLSRHAFWLMPEGILRTILRYIGFRAGLVERHIPLNIKRKISMNPGYFKIE